MRVRVVFPLHGVRTRAEWQREFSDVAHPRGWRVRLSSWNFGRFSILPFLWPPARERKIRWFRDTYRSEMDTRELGPDVVLPSVIAHSFGTYILGHALIRYPFIRLDKVLLCGSILPRDFPWGKLIERGQVQSVRNEFGIRDTWCRVVHWFVSGSGPSGVKGFLDPNSARFEQERFHYTHSEYFSALHMGQVWIPFLDRPVDVSNPVTIEVAMARSSAPWGLYGFLTVLVFALISSGLALKTAGFSTSSPTQPTGSRVNASEDEGQTEGHPGDNLGKVGDRTLVDPNTAPGAGGSGSLRQIAIGTPPPAPPPAQAGTRGSSSIDEATATPAIPSADPSRELVAPGPPPTEARVTHSFVVTSKRTKRPIRGAEVHLRAEGVQMSLEVERNDRTKSVELIASKSFTLTVTDPDHEPFRITEVAQSLPEAIELEFKPKVKFAHEDAVTLVDDPRLEGRVAVCLREVHPGDKKTGVTWINILEANPSKLAELAASSKKSLPRDCRYPASQELRARLSKNVGDGFSRQVEIPTSDGRTKEFVIELELSGLPGNSNDDGVSVRIFDSQFQQ